MSDTENPAPTPAAPPAEEELRLSPRALEERLRRANAKYLEDEFGTRDIAALRAKLAGAEKLESEMEEKRKAAMTETDRLRAEASEAKSKAARMEEMAAEARAQAYLAEVAASKGIKDVGLARYRVEEKLKTMADGEELDESQFLDDLLKDPRHAAAFGVVPATTAAPAAAKRPATTTPATSKDPRPDGTPGETGAKESFMDLPPNDPRYLAALRHHGL